MIHPAFPNSWTVREMQEERRPVIIEQTDSEKMISDIF